MSCILVSPSPPNKACTGQVGFVAIFRHFSGFEFSLLPSRVHARPPASNANRWATGIVRVANRQVWCFQEKHAID